MASSSFFKPVRLGRADWVFGCVLIVAVVVLHLTTDLIDTLENRILDFAGSRSKGAPAVKVSVIAIDDPSIAKLGTWPWSRDNHASIIDQLAAAKAKTIVYAVPFFAPQLDRGLNYIRQFKVMLSAGNTASALPDVKLAALMDQAEITLDGDAQLADSIKRAGNVLLACQFGIGQALGKSVPPLPAFALRSALNEPAGFSVAASTARLPIERFGSAAAGVGHMNQPLDVDGVFRREALLVNYAGTAVPSLALLATLRSFGLTMADLKLSPDEAMQLGTVRLKTDANARLLPQFYEARGGLPAFAMDSFYDVVSGKIPASRYAGRVVIIGLTARAEATPLRVPGNPALSPVEVIANTISSILSERFILEPRWGAGATLAVLLLVVAYVLAILPRLSTGLAGLISFLLLAALLGTEFGLLAAAALWLKLVFPATLLLIGYLAWMTKHLLVAGPTKTGRGQQLPETDRMLGLALQSQGQLDLAFERFQRVPTGDGIMDNLHALALDFERLGQPDKAEAVSAYIAAHSPAYKNSHAKLEPGKNLPEMALVPAIDAAAGGASKTNLSGKSMLGRYQIERALGKGAMGLVYLGKDPKIGRVVAIKTMALGNEFEGQSLVDARERFFREAETAGRLQHQHIVTIFDVGEEGDLAYIAMEFLKGKDLADFCKRDNLLPIRMVLSIVARVAEALAYAHRQHVVHRDIKPANVMFDIESDTVKVTDFGIARITDSSRTKTGLVLGTPSFMSPEQLMGKKVDGRSDLYSLGVMLFQLLAGELPFRAGSMAELMHKIANQAVPDIRSMRQELPTELAQLLAFSLGKLPQSRFQDGDQFAVALRSVLAGLRDVAAADASSRPASDAMDIEI